MSAPTALKRTPLYHAHVASGARMTEFGGWDMPLSYSGQLAEHRAVRTGVGIFDVSHMGQVRITGAEALPYLQMLLPADFSALKHTEAKYSQLCTELGGVVDDLIVSRVGDHEFFAVVNAGTREKDGEWMRAKARQMGFGDVEIADESSDWAMIAVQGPAALAMLDKLIPAAKWSATKAFTLHPFMHQGEICLLSRTGYTGETGAELIVPAPQAEEWWHLLVDAGAVPCGLASRDSLRLEAGYCLYGSDLDEKTTPVEAGLSWSIGWKKPEKFLGRTILEKQKAEGAGRKLVALRTDSRRPLRHGDKVTSGGVEVGEVTSGGFSPGLEAGIALAYIKTDAVTSTNLEVQQRGAGTPARIVKAPFVVTSLKQQG